MEYGLCHLSIVPVRKEPSDISEMVTQLLYGDHFKIIEQRKNWVKIRISFDEYEGWIDSKQFVVTSSENYHQIASEFPKTATNLVDYIITESKQLMAISAGAVLNAIPFLNHQGDVEFNSEVLSKEKIIETALLYLNVPYLWGGKSPFGIDCSGFTQMVYKLTGHRLFRDAKQQATQGETLSFIEESEPGDLAFFDNPEGIITHVGIIMPEQHIIHAHGKVRIAKLDHSGIFNLETNKHSHKLRVIKQMI